MKFSTFHLFHRFEGQTTREVYDYQLEIAELCEELGFDGIWVAEHHFRDYGLVPNIFTLLSYLAARTDRLRLGTGIVVLPLHNPVHVAEEAAMGPAVRRPAGDGHRPRLPERRVRGLRRRPGRGPRPLQRGAGDDRRPWTPENFHHEGKFYGTGTRSP